MSLSSMKKEMSKNKSKEFGVSHPLPVPRRNESESLHLIPLLGLIYCCLPSKRRKRGARERGTLLSSSSLPHRNNHNKKPKLGISHQIYTWISTITLFIMKIKYSQVKSNGRDDYYYYYNYIISYYFYSISRKNERIKRKRKGHEPETMNFIIPVATRHTHTQVGLSVHYILSHLLRLSLSTFIPFFLLGISTYH